MLSPAPKPVGAYMPARIVGQHLYVSKDGTLLPAGTLKRGRMGCDLDAAEIKVFFADRARRLSAVQATV